MLFFFLNNTDRGVLVSIRMAHSGSMRTMKHLSVAWTQSRQLPPPVLKGEAIPESIQPTEDIDHTMEAPVVLHKKTPEQLHYGGTQTGCKEGADAMVTYSMFWVTWQGMWLVLRAKPLFPTSPYPSLGNQKGPKVMAWKRKSSVQTTWEAGKHPEAHVQNSRNWNSGSIVTPGRAPKCLVLHVSNLRVTIITGVARLQETQGNKHLQRDCAPPTPTGERSHE